MTRAFLPITILALAGCASGDRTPTTSTQEQQAVSGNVTQIPPGGPASGTTTPKNACTSSDPSVNTWDGGNDTRGCMQTNPQVLTIGYSDGGQEHFNQCPDGFTVECFGGIINASLGCKASNLPNAGQQYYCCPCPQ
jgi:hypothetical protein